MTPQPQTQNTRPVSQAESFFAHFSIQDSEFKNLQALIYDKTGIVIKENKRYLLVNRLAKRLRHLGLKSFTDYIKYVSGGAQAQPELVELIDAVTTNKTDFYREIKHFHYLEQTVLTAFVQVNKSSFPFKVWSSASSSGEEPYTILITLAEFFSKYPGMRFEILGTDISETMLRQCVSGVYQKDKVHPIPPHLLKKYFVTDGTDYKVKPELTKPVSFKKLNLLQDFQRTLRGYDVIFCRNVMIYFDKGTQEKIVNKMYDVLKPGGYLFIGHSETLHGMNTQYEYISPSVYRKTV
jgi:chemotaxis protein methyltransferase CheR